MDVALWAEIRRLHSIEKFSIRATAKTVGSCTRTVKKALAMDAPPAKSVERSQRLLKPFMDEIDALINTYPKLSAVRILEEISKSPHNYTGSIYSIRRYLRTIRPPQGRIYQEVFYEPGEATQIDWGTCGWIKVGGAKRRVSVFVAVLCYSRLCFIKFTLSQSKECFYRAIAESFEFFGGTTRKLIIDNLKAAVLDGHGRNARLHPEFIALCGHYPLEPAACQRRDPESKGSVECNVKYVKNNALQGRDEQLQTITSYRELAIYWRDHVANVRIHGTTKKRPIDLYSEEKQHLRVLPPIKPNTDDDAPRIVSNHCRIRFDANRYSVPPEYAGKPVAVKANDTSVWVLHDGEEITRHIRCYDKQKLCCKNEHRLAALEKRHRAKNTQLENEFNALGEHAQAFHIRLLSVPVQKNVHLKKILSLAHVYGRADILKAIESALQAEVYDAESVENILMQNRRQQKLPSLTPVRPKKVELIDNYVLPEPDLSRYDQMFGLDDNLGEHDESKK